MSIKTLAEKLRYGHMFGAVSRTSRYGIWAADLHDERDSVTNTCGAYGDYWLRRQRGRRRQQWTTPTNGEQR